MITFSQLNKAFLVSVSVLLLAACTSSTSAVDGSQSKTATVAEKKEAETSGNSDDAASEAEEKNEEIKAAKIIREPGAVADRGTFVKMVVNRNAVTNSDLKRRAAFLRLRRVSGNRTKLAENEMIEQILQLQEAQRLNVLATDAQVDASFANFAKQNRATPSQLARELGRLGVGADHFKQYIRTQMSWQRAVGTRFQSQTTRISEQQAILKLRESGQAKPELTEYAFQQVVFVVPKDKRSKSALAARKREATAFRQQFTTCDETLSKVKGLRDVSVINRSRIMEPELPDRWRSDVAKLGGQGTTVAKETEKGVEFIAICSTRTVSDDRAAQISGQFNEFEGFAAQGNEFSEKYLSELKSRATIIYK
ncbi:MAG: peptidylprolyl isomerase [Rhizobiaceae bacterium]|nr:peptidylprolyl isomerase [Rhizobiaceae bacterium]